MEIIKKPRRAFKVDEESTTLLPDYLENIAGDIYLTLTEFEGDNYVHIRKFYNDSDGYLKAKKEGVALTLDQFAIFLDLTDKVESRYWALEEGLGVEAYENFIGPWKLTIDVFGYINIWKYFYDPTIDQLHPSKKGISLPLIIYRPLAREMFNLLERYAKLRDWIPCYKSKHSPLAKCDICYPFEKFKKPNDEVFPIESLAN